MDMSKPNPTPPNFQTKDFFNTPALSLTLAGIFRDGGGAGGGKKGEEKGGSSGGGGGVHGGGGGGKEVETTVEISSENSGPLRSRTISDEDLVELIENDEQDDEDENNNNNNNKKKRKKYHRHTSDQIKEMEALFKECPHPDEKQREQLSKQLGLHPRQVKFWFQNRRTQIKTVQERHENTLLKMELEKLREENRSLRTTVPQAASCLKCGFTNFTNHVSVSVSMEEQQLRIENARLKVEIENLRTTVGRYASAGTPQSSSSGCAENAMETKSCLDLYTGMFGIEKSRIMEVVNQALQELNQMAFCKEPLWIHSFETGREILNYDEYMKQFPAQFSENGQPKKSIEASRDTGIVFIDLPQLVQIFVDVNQWKEIFPCLISKATTVDVIFPGEGANKDGLIQLMFAELQMLTPLVPTREVYFIRYSKQLSVDKWAIVDVSIDQLEDTIDASLTKCRKRPSGCIIEDKANGHSQVTWIEHLECQKSITVNSLYRATVNSGLGFGAKHWMTTLMTQCERLVFFMATNVPTKDSSGVATISGRKSIFRLAQRMTVGLCRALGASTYNTWSKITGKNGEDIRVASRKNLNEPGEPLGTILCAVCSTWLQVSQHVLFEFLRDPTNRNKWDIMSNGGPVQLMVNLGKGKDRGNAVAIQTMQSQENNMWVLQDSCTNEYESMIVYALVDINGMQSVMTGCDSSNIAVLPSGFSILPDGMESRSMVITSKPEEKNTDGGSLLTIAFQIVTGDSLTAKLSVESIESLNTLISRTLQKIKSSLDCEDG